MTEDSTWDVSEVGDNLPNVIHDGDPLKLDCPDCGMGFSIYVSIIVEDGSVECEHCGSEFGLQLVRKDSLDTESKQ